MDLEMIIVKEVSQAEKDKMPCDITYVWNQKDDTNELIYETETAHRHREQTYGYQMGKAGGEG